MYLLTTISWCREEGVNKIVMKHEQWFHEAAKTATQGFCERDRCGAVIVKDSTIIGSGYNAPPGDDTKTAKCRFEYLAEIRKPKSDRTCCVHAEWRAILDALRRNPEKLIGSTLYFARVDENGKNLFSGDPYCTVCSRLALDTGIRHFALWREEDIRVYDTVEYNDLSYQFFHPKKS